MVWWLCFVATSVCSLFFLYGYGDHRALHVLPHSFPTRRSSDLSGVPEKGVAAFERLASEGVVAVTGAAHSAVCSAVGPVAEKHNLAFVDRKSTRLNSSH